MKQMYDLQKKAKELQKKLETITVEQAEGGVKVKVNGVFKVEALEIDPSYLALDKKEKLETLLCKLLSETIQEVQKRSAMQSQELLKGFSL